MDKVQGSGIGAKPLFRLKYNTLADRSLRCQVSAQSRCWDLDTRRLFGILKNNCNACRWTTLSTHVARLLLQSPLIKWMWWHFSSVREYCIGSCPLFPQKRLSSYDANNTWPFFYYLTFLIVSMKYAKQLHHVKYIKMRLRLCQVLYRFNLSYFDVTRTMFWTFCSWHFH